MVNGKEVSGTSGEGSTLKEDKDSTTPLNREATIEERVDRLEAQLDDLLIKVNELRWTVNVD